MQFENEKLKFMIEMKNCIEEKDNKNYYYFTFWCDSIKTLKALQEYCYLDKVEQLGEEEGEYVVTDLSYTWQIQGHIRMDKFYHIDKVLRKINNNLNSVLTRK